MPTDDPNGPKKEVGPADETGANLTKSSRRDAFHSISASRSTPLRRRRAASWRMAPLRTGHADPWRYQPLASGYEDAAAHLLAAGLTPAPDRDGLREMWRRGSDHRRDAARIAQAWELAQ